jgi:hypothetical protein
MALGPWTPTTLLIASNEAPRFAGNFRRTHCSLLGNDTDRAPRLRSLEGPTLGPDGSSKSASAGNTRDSNDVAYRRRRWRSRGLESRRSVKCSRRALRSYRCSTRPTMPCTSCAKHFASRRRGEGTSPDAILRRELRAIGRQNGHRFLSHAA